VSGTPAEQPAVPGAGPSQSSAATPGPTPNEPTPAERPGAGRRRIERAEALSPTLRREDLAAPELTGDSRTRVAAREAALTRPDPMVGLKLAGRYAVTRKLGEGGMGAVYEARHTLIGKRVAIKVLLDKYAQKPNVIARLQQEARLASAIGHPNIVDITDFGKTEDGRTFVVMEYLEGESLAQLIAREGPIAPERSLGICRQVADALAAAHAKGILHRDVKPENIFICQRQDRDFIKVVDFGISKSVKPGDDEEESPRLTQTGMVLGTPLYMSPEQARGEDQLDHRIDIYALGVILYETTTGEVPFRGTNYLGIISQVLTQDVVPPRLLRPDLAISEACERVILKAMAKDRDERYASMAELTADLDRLLVGDHNVSAIRPLVGIATTRDQVPTGRITLPRRATTQLTSRRLPGWAFGLVLVVLGGGAFAAVWRLTRGSEELGAGPAADATVMAASVPTSPATPTTTSAPTSVRVRIVSLPPGAHVRVAEDDYGPTPLEVTVPWSDRPVLVRARLDGFEDAVETIVPHSDSHVQLALREKKRPPKAGARRPGAETKTPASSPLHETLPNPYEKPRR
jgi:serine/threonine-protein kinase